MNMNTITKQALALLIFTITTMPAYGMMTNYWRTAKQYAFKAAPVCVKYGFIKPVKALGLLSTAAAATYGYRQHCQTIEARIYPVKSEHSNHGIQSSNAHQTYNIIDTALLKGTIAVMPHAKFITQQIQLPFAACLKETWNGTGEESSKMAYSCKAQYPTLAGNIERFKKQTDLESHCYDAKVTVSKSSGNVTCELNLLTATPYSRLDREQVLAEIPGLFKGISPVLEGADVECTHVPTKDHRYTATAMIKKAIQ